jgi:hypothetical protein
MCAHINPSDATRHEPGRDVIGVLVDAHAVCPADCDALVFLELRTWGELSRAPQCPNGCGELEIVPVREITV